MDNVFKVPGVLSEAWLLFIKVSATFYNQQLERWFSKLCWRSEWNVNCSKKFPFKKFFYSDFLAVNPLETTFSSSKILFFFLIFKLIGRKRMQNTLKKTSCLMSYQVHYVCVLSGEEQRRLLNTEQGHQHPPLLRTLSSAWFCLSSGPGGFFVPFSPGLSWKPKYSMQA